jgi:PAS domain S-box-containing protein
MEEPMSAQPKEEGKSKSSRSAFAALGGVPQVWLVLPFFILALWAGSALARLAPNFKWESLPLVAAAIATAMFALMLNRMLLRPVPAAPGPETVGAGLRELLDSAGPAVVAMDLEGQMIYCNSAAERLLGYHAAELLIPWAKAEILAPGESDRLLAEMQKLCRADRTPALTLAARRVAYIDCLRKLPPGTMPSFEAQVRNKTGVIFPVTFQISPLRDASGELTGMVAVAVDQSAAQQGEQALRESQERYRDLFENSSDMIATLSPAGKFLYANPAWKRCFELDPAALMALEFFYNLFESGIRGETAGLFRRALDGEAVERAPLRHHTPDGRVIELELSFSRRQRAGKAMAVRCLLRDVTQQRQHENRLALQLAVSQIVGEDGSGGSTGMRILEALCISQGWDVAIEWVVGAEQKQLEFGTAWGAPGRRVEALIQASMVQTLEGGSELPEQAWKDGRPVWVTDLAMAPPSPRVAAALDAEMVSGWAVPVRAGSKLLAVLEFYCHFRLREDREAMAAVETAAVSLGQLLARSQERGQVDDLTRRQEVLLDSVADGICGLDSQGKVTFANAAATRLLGTPADALIGRPVHDILHCSLPADRNCEEDCPLRHNTATPCGRSGEHIIFRASGASFPAEFVMTPIRGQGRVLGAVLSFRDISQRYALDQLKDEFISTVSHELRTPLTSIRGALGLLTSGILGETNEKASNLLRIAVTNSDRLVRLINDILDLERMQSGREPLAFRTVQLADIVKQAIGDMQPLAEAAGVQLIHDATQVEIAADRDRLLQVLTNLLSNAVKFSPPNSPVSVMLRPGITGVILSVIDHGRGIPVDKLESIFGRFQQVDASDSRQKGGTGLGLAICRTIVLQHSGRIWAERNPVRGSTFRIFLPYQPAPVGAPGRAPGSEAGHGTVVLADSNAKTRPRIAAQLARHGYSVIQAANVEQTLSAASQNAQAILLDTSLDGMNGWEILPLLRRMDATSHTPVVLLSVEDPHSPTELPAGAVGWVANPLQEDELLAELARVLCGSGDKARILIVEDDRDLAGVISEVFARDSIVVLAAHSLKETIAACSAFKPHLILLDIGLPDGDGFNVVDWLRQRADLARLPLVVYSGRELSQEQRRQLTLGPTYFLAKTRVQPQQLEALVLTMLRSARQADEAATPETAVPNS